MCTLSTAPPPPPPPPPPTEVPDPVYVYDHRGLRVKKDSLPSSETGNELETTPTIVLDPQEEGINIGYTTPTRRFSGYTPRVATSGVSLNLQVGVV